MGELVTAFKLPILCSMEDEDKAGFWVAVFQFRQVFKFHTGAADAVNENEVVARNILGNVSEKFSRV